MACEPSADAENVARRCARACAALALCTLLAACDDGVAPPVDDAGTTADVVVPSGGMLDVTLGLDPDGLEDGSTLERVALRLGGLRVRGDRGGELDPVLVGPFEAELASGPFVRDVVASPATYSALALRLEPAPGAPSFVLRYRETDGTTVEIVDALAIDLDLRCESAALLDPGGRAQLSAAFELREIQGEVRGASSLPAPVDGVVHIDAASAPDVVARIRREALHHWHVDCRAE